MEQPQINASSFDMRIKLVEKLQFHYRGLLPYKWFHKSVRKEQLAGLTRLLIHSCLLYSLQAIESKYSNHLGYSLTAKDIPNWLTLSILIMFPPQLIIVSPYRYP